MIESPTGTGKTLCLLCSTLAWKQSFQDWIKAVKNYENNEICDYEKLHRAAFGSLPFNIKRGLDQPMPRIYFASRTHSQLSQAMHELANTSFSPKARILGSREQVCIHPSVSSAKPGSKAALCRVKVDKNSCEFHKGSNFYANRVKLDNTIMDIEDLITFGQKNTACPFYLSKDTQNQADIIFLPYNYLIDKTARTAMGVNIANSIIIFDEAHNLESFCCDAASFEISSSDLEKAKIDAEFIAGVVSHSTSWTYKDYGYQYFINLSKNIQKLVSLLWSMPFSKTTMDIVKPGEYIYEILKVLNINHENQVLVRKVLEDASHLLSTQKHGDRCGLNLLRDAINAVFRFPLDGQSLKYYKFYAQKRDVFSREKRDKVSSDISLNFWCFSSAIAMNDLKNEQVRSIILASGTLSPLDSFAKEMGIPFPNMVENTHVIHPCQVHVSVVPKGPEQHILSSAYNQRDNLKYIRDLGNAICNFCRCIPDGVLVFFTSYSALLLSQTEWKKGPNSLWERLSRDKRIFVEPKEKEEFARVIQDYEDAISKNDKGAILLAVCRGKASEGLDFSDKKSRGVIICGIPYPHSKDPKIIQKKSIIDSNRDYGMFGYEWYSQQAARAVNQALGRVIRHRKDYGAILLCDERFGQPQVIKQLPLWIRPFVQRENEFGKIHRNLSKFFKSLGNGVDLAISSYSSDLQQPAFDVYPSRTAKRKPGAVDLFSVENVSKFEKQESVFSVKNNESTILKSKASLNQSSNKEPVGQRENDIFQQVKSFSDTKSSNNLFEVNNEHKPKIFVDENRIDQKSLFNFDESDRKVGLLTKRAAENVFKVAQNDMKDVQIFKADEPEKKQIFSVDAKENGTTNNTNKDIFAIDTETKPIQGKRSGLEEAKIYMSRVKMVITKPKVSQFKILIKKLAANQVSIEDFLSEYSELLFPRIEGKRIVNSHLLELFKDYRRFLSKSHLKKFDKYLVNFE